MPIRGIGIDIEEVGRFRKAPAALLRRIFTPREIEECRGRPESFAARFAAKEAFLKALGTGYSRGIGWRDLEVARTPGRPPTLRAAGKGRALLNRMGARRLHLSLTHSARAAAAVVILES